MYGQRIIAVSAIANIDQAVTEATLLTPPWYTGEPMPDAQYFIAVASNNAVNQGLSSIYWQPDMEPR